MQKAETRSEYDDALAFLRGQCEMAADYLDDLCHEKTFHYAISKTHSCVGVKTNNLVEQVNGAWNTLREEAPYRLNRALLTWLGECLHKRQEMSAGWMNRVPAHKLTKYCRILWEIQVQFP
jgi:hypothetical protein